MKILSKLFFVMLIIASSLYSQPQISYILPDIGSADMNVYVEIIAPQNAKGSFGTDGFYINNKNDNFRVECLNPVDTSKIIIGPCVVSWEGRSISTQIYIRKEVTPNSDYWDNLTSDYRIPIRVKVGTTYSNIDTFYIVKPFAFGDKRSSSDRFLGQDALGRRSKRGAMIVDYMLLANSNYYVSTNDCDPISQGNQGYLPFVLLAKQYIRGAGSTTSINVAGNNHNGGPGGGGGGGYFFDASLINQSMGSDGGAGFTGGGPGGRNCSLCENKFNNMGTGTGPNGTSLNGVPAPFVGWYEASGGGTGHPFGLPGDGCDGGVTCTPSGRYGGGSGRQQHDNGGAGGYATDGEGSSSGLNNGGKAHGNSMGVPIAGGSGGASGNPNSTHERSGNGGGGGGAIVVASNTLINLKVNAQGENSPQSSYGRANGGSGSGGFVNIHSKDYVQDLAVNFSGGVPGGGVGRARADVFAYNQSIAYNPNNHNPYIGITTDTSSYVKRNFNLKGTKDPNKKIYFYLKPISGTWQLIADNDINSTNWNLDINLIGDDTTYFFAVVQENLNTSVAEYGYEPAFVLSQAAANIFHLIKEPNITGDTLANINIIACNSFTVTDTSYIKNIGEANLILNFQSASFTNNYPEFELISPKTKTYVFPNDSVPVIVKYTYDPTKTGEYDEFLLVKHNDSNEKSNNYIWKIKYHVKIIPLGLQVVDINNIIKIDTIDLGNHCVGDIADSVFAIKNISGLDVVLDNPQFNNSDDVAIIYLGKKSLTVSDTTYATIALIISKKGLNYKKIYFKTFDCDDILDSLVVIANGVTTELTHETVLNFSKLRIGKSDTLQLSIKNTGDADAYFDFLQQLTGAYKIIKYEPFPPCIIKPNDSIIVFIEYSPVNENGDTLCVELISKKQNGACIDTSSFCIFGLGTGPKLKLSKYILDYSTIAICIEKIDSIQIKNEGTADINITKQTIITGIDKVNFEIIAPIPQATFTLKPGQSETFYIKFLYNSSFVGNKNAQIEIRTDDIGEDSLIIIPLKGKFEDFNLEYSPSEINFGVFPIGEPYTRELVIKNNAELSVHINSITTTNNKITITPNNDITILGAADSKIFTIVLSNQYLIEGDLLDSIFINYDIQCNKHDTIVIKGKGISGKLAYLDKIDFAEVVWCKDSIIKMVYVNTGDAAIQFVSMTSIQGNDSQLFEFTDGLSSPAAKVLNKNDSLIREIRFMPASSTDGIKTAFFTSKFIIDGKEQDFKTELRGERITGLLSIPNKVDFGNVILGASLTKKVILKNTGKTIIALSDILGLNNPTIFSLNPNQIHEILKPGDSIIISITFTPQNIGLIFDTLDLQLAINNNDCISRNKIIIMGNGIPPVNVTLWLPKDTLVTPDLNNFIIPIYAALENETDTLKDIGLTAEISFNASVFYPRLFNKKGTILRRIEGHNMIATIDIDTINIFGKNTIIGELIGHTMLGEVDNTTLHWESLVWKQSQFVDITNTIDGKLSLIICKESGDRLLKYNAPTYMYIKPNPSKDDINIEVGLLEVGEHRITISNLQGIACELKKWNVNLNDDRIFNYKVSINDYYSGVYYITLYTPTKVFVKPLYIIK